MTTLRDIFDYSAFDDAVYQGYIRVQTHPEFPELSIANYSEKSQYERLWTPEILASRGLIYNNQTLDVIARGFPKFFNFDDTSQPNPPVGPMIRSTKFDGSLGILYMAHATLRIATRGSFASDQAIRATTLLRDTLIDLGEGTSEFDVDGFALTYGRVTNYGAATELFNLIKDGYTPLFEIIYPENRIVVDYKGESRLVLLDVVENATGASDLAKFDELYWPDKADKQLIPGGFFDTIAGDIPDGEEGFVLYWPSHDFRCKVKSAQYVELHRLVTGLSKKVIWEMVGQGKSSADIKDGIPDELFKFVDDTIVELNESCAALIDEVYSAFDSLNFEYYAQLSEATREGGPAKHRAVFARIIGKPQWSAARPYLFRILDGAQPEDIWKMAWKTLKPSGDTRAFAQSEDTA